ncbi:Myb_DNA-bind_4 domain-containing protein [Cephalotus follicularis]|uniref:Myb_DNA-bind_4 domain-containing protein n=1 Tax=Cephalotus follicularis TaxID=3775 RepID=A0A1Q3CGX6_CEPFO|nr:Myb_DNA-bind_4 domain-containing protein [Cephalotus follicularis]
MKWSEHEKFVLFEIWGDIFMQLGRNSLRNEDWANVAERVTDALKIEISETQCRRVMNDFKRRYKKEKGKVEKFGGFSKWVFFKKMDMLMLREEECGGGLACGVDSGEFVFMDTAVYLERSNGFDEMRDSPCESEMEEEDEEEGVGEVEGEEGEMSVLADSVERFGEIYEKIEISKREQMRELERMRAEFCRELEAQKKQILERTHAEIAKIREGDGEDDSDYDYDDDDDDDDDEEEEEEEEEEENENISD